MIDTIHLKIHGIRTVNKNLLNAVKYAKNKRSSLHSVEMTREEYASFINKRSTMMFFAQYADSGRTQLIDMASEFTEPSSNYKVRIRPRLDRDYLEVNLSVPKFLYGHNVGQFIIDISDPIFSITRHQMFKYQAQDVHNKLIKFIKFFFVRVFNTIPDFRTVQVMRIDYCYNQIFHSKQAASDYLRVQKGIRKMYYKGTDINDYKNTVWFPATYHTFKIYAKGDEFKKHDLKNLRRFNALNEGKRIKNIDRILALAERTNRYEITYKNAGIDYIYKTRYLPRVNRRNSEEIKKYLRLNVRRRNKKLLEIQKHTWNYYNKQYHKRHEFYLEIPEELKENKKNFLSERYVYKAKFDIDLFHMLATKFYEVSQEFKIKKTYGEVGMDLLNIKEKLLIQKRKYSSRKNFASSGISLFLQELAKNNFNFDSVKNSGIFPEASFYRYKKQLKNIGIDQRNKGTLLHVIEKPFNYEDYFNELRYKSFL